MRSPGTITYPLQKEEIAALQSRTHLEQEEMLLYKALIQEVYDHLTMLVNTMKSSQERYKRLATRDMLNRRIQPELLQRNHGSRHRAGKALRRAPVLHPDRHQRLQADQRHLRAFARRRGPAGMRRDPEEIHQKSGFSLPVRRGRVRHRHTRAELPVQRVSLRADSGEHPAVELPLRHARLPVVLQYRLCCLDRGNGHSQVLHEADLEMYKEKKKNNNR